MNPSSGQTRAEHLRYLTKAAKKAGASEETRYRAMLNSLALQTLLKLGGEQNSRLHQELLALTRDVWAYSRIEKEEDKVSP